MITILSPAKTLNYDIQPKTTVCSQPDFLDEASVIIEKLRSHSPKQLQKLMSINPKLAELNAMRFLDWKLPFTPENAKQALLVFKGEVYNGLLADTLAEPDLLFAQQHLRILSGMYGVLRPLDLMQPYRLEMGTNLKVSRKKDLYHFWSIKLTDYFNELLETGNHDYIINLASDEYFNALDQKKIKAKVIKPVFKDFHNGSYKFITVYGKKARGMMARFILQNQIVEADQLKLFDEGGYYFNDKMSEGSVWVFTRG